MAKNEKLAKEVTIRQIRSGAGRTAKLKRSLKALGMGRIGNKRSFKNPNAALMAQIRHVEYLLEVKSS